MAERNNSGRKKTPNQRRKTASVSGRKSFALREKWQGLRASLSNTFDRERGRFIVGLVMLTASLFALISTISYFFTAHVDQSLVQNLPTDAEEHTYKNIGKALGAHIGEWCVNDFLGVGSFFIFFFFTLLAIKFLGLLKRLSIIKWFVFSTIMALWGALTFALIDHRLGLDLGYRLGGVYGDLWYDFLNVQIGLVGIILAVFLCLAIVIVIVYRESMHKMRSAMQMGWAKRPHFKKNSTLEDNDEEPLANEDLDEPEEEDFSEEEEPEEDDMFPATHSKPETKPEPTRPMDIVPQSQPVEAQTPKLEVEPRKPLPRVPVQTLQEEAPIEVVLASGDSDSQPAANTRTVTAEDNHFSGRYTFPSVELLNEYESGEPEIDMQEIEDNKQLILQALESFNIRTTPRRVTVGPSVTLFEVVPDAGIKISRIRNLEDEMALSIKSSGGIRIIGPLQGGTVGIEVPNKSPRTVSMRSVLDSKKFKNSTFQLPVAMGRTITNDVYMFDLAKMPHLLIAGATGQGKSVGLNAMITSLLYSKLPSELKFVLIDPKMLEFSIYESISKQYLASLPDEDQCIVTNMDKVVPTLNSICIEMDARYQLLTQAKVRNVVEYNAMIKEGRLKPQDGHSFLPYIVVIIDEFADLIMTSGKEVERPIARIAQKARAAGIHMVIATQRPSADVITGIIKANFPARIAFKVFSAIDSRTILDSSGANQLVGRGDMLFFQGKEMERIQCAFIDTPETERIMTHIHNQESPLEPYRLPEATVDSDGKPKGTLDVNERDALFEEVALMVVQSQQGSTSNIQRRFNIGYNRAGRIMDQLEATGIVSSQDGSKPRQVLVSDEQALQSYL